MGVPFCAFFSYLFSNKRLTHTDLVGELITIIFHVIMALRYEIKSVQTAQKPLPDCDEREWLFLRLLRQ